LQPTGVSHNDTCTLNTPGDALLFANYDLSNIIDIATASFNQKTIRLTLNKDFIGRAKQLYEYHQKIKNLLESDWDQIHKHFSSIDKCVFNSLIDMNILAEDNFNILKKYIEQHSFFPFPPFFPSFGGEGDVYEYMKTHPSKISPEYAKSLGFGMYDDP
jgi:hypothetical protein